MNRRNFIQKSSLVCAGAAILHPAISSALFKPGMIPGIPDIAVCEGTDYFRSTLTAIEDIGGISKFIKRGDKVGILINSDFEIPGTFVNPDISLAILKLCREAGAGEITLLQYVKEEYWKRSIYFNEYEGLLSELVNLKENSFPAKLTEPTFRLLHEVPGAKILKDIEIVSKSLECDVFINIPIAKHHATALLTSSLKNLMGLNTRKTNVSFHLGSGKRDDPEYFAQCLADMSKLRKSDLVVVDSTLFLTTNGPSGPGEVKQLDKVLAGTDPVALDAYCAGFLDFAPEDVLAIVKAHEMGIGTMYFQNLEIKENRV